MILSIRLKELKFYHFLLNFVLCFFSANASHSQGKIPDNVLEIFENQCAISGCHLGSNAAENLNLTGKFALYSLVNQASRKKPGNLLVKPGDSANSYLIMKLNGDPRIAGEQMPRESEPLFQTEISALEKWIDSLPAGMRVEPPERVHGQAFPGLSLASLLTSKTLDKGTFSYRIAHRFRGQVVDGGFARFFGLDDGAHMFTELAFAINDNLLVNVSRSGENATIEFGAKWRFLREKTGRPLSFSAALYAGVDWETVREITDPDNRASAQFLRRIDAERFHWFAQAAFSKQITDRISVLVVPGILINGNVEVTDEDPLFTIGLGGKFRIVKDFSIFVEGVPILSGGDQAAPVGGPRRNGNSRVVVHDAFTLGFEHKVGGHVFHVYITNSLGLATNQYMNGGNLDFANGDFRLGFNIYRVLRIPF